MLAGHGAYFAHVAVRRFPGLRARGAVVLIIADDPVAREVYAELFAMRGYSVATACGAREGILAARDRAVVVAVLAVNSGVAQLRKRLHAVRPTLRLHVTGMLPLCFDVMAAQVQKRLH